MTGPLIIESLSPTRAVVRAEEIDILSGSNVQDVRIGEVACRGLKMHIVLAVSSCNCTSPPLCAGWSGRGCGGDGGSRRGLERCDQVAGLEALRVIERVHVAVGRHQAGGHFAVRVPHRREREMIGRDMLQFRLSIDERAIDMAGCVHRSQLGRLVDGPRRWYCGSSGFRCGIETEIEFVTDELDLRMIDMHVAIEHRLSEQGLLVIAGDELERELSAQSTRAVDVGRVDGAVLGRVLAVGNASAATLNSACAGPGMSAVSSAPL